MGKDWKRALIVGASSGIGESLALLLGKQGCSVAMVARRNEELVRIASEIERNGGGPVYCYPHDVRETGKAASLFQQITHDLGGLDLIIYSAGVMPLMTDEEYSLDKDMNIIDVNVKGAVAWLNEAARRFASEGKGTLVGISSVAGDRGRRGMPVYSASKAFFDAYLEGLRNRISRFGVTVVTAKPGPVDTPMTHGLKKLPMLISSEQAAISILKSCERGGVIYIPGKWRPIMWVVRHIPSPVFRRMNI